MNDIIEILMQFISKILFKILKDWWKYTVSMRLCTQGVKIGIGAKFYGMPIVSMAKDSQICIGERVVICSDSRFTALGVSHPVVLRTLRPRSEIIIGSDCGISGTSICAAISVTIGKECLFGADVLIADNDFHPIKPEGRRYNSNVDDIAAKPVVIGDNVFIGTRSMILKGVNIGENSVIGAGSVVVSDIPAGVVAAGNPARVVRRLDNNSTLSYLEDNKQMNNCLYAKE